MPEVDVNLVIEAPIERVWELVTNIKDYPRLMECVNSIVARDISDRESEADWEVTLRDSILRWSEREYHDPEAYRVEYEQIDGDLDVWEGYWQLEALGESRTQVQLYVRFEIGIPMLHKMLNPVAQKAIRENSISMLNSILEETHQ